MFRIILYSLFLLSVLICAVVYIYMTLVTSKISLKKLEEEFRSLCDEYAYRYEKECGENKEEYDYSEEEAVRMGMILQSYGDKELNVKDIKKK